MSGSKQKFLTVCICIVMTLLKLVTSQVTIGGNIAQDTTLTLSDSPYTIDNDIVIESNVTLTIDPGVVLRFDPGVGIFVNGSLVASGSETQRITFTASVPSSILGSPYSWSGIEWAPDADSLTERVDFIWSTRSTSSLSYVDITAAGALFEGNGTLQYAGTGPALFAIGVAPVLHNVRVNSNFGSGVEWRDISMAAEMSESELSHNGGHGLSFTSDGIGKLSIDRSVFDGNDEDGIVTNFIRPDDSMDFPRFQFCSQSMDIDDHIYLDHETSDFVDNTYACMRVLSSPPGSTLTAYVLSASGSSGTELTFWNGNSTEDDDTISVRRLRYNEIDGNEITTSTNSITIEVSRPSSWYSTAFSLFITVQKGTDYDFLVSNTNSNNNTGHGVNIQALNRGMVMMNSVLNMNFDHGIYIGRNYGQVVLTSTTIESNGASGFSSVRDYGDLSIDKCSFLNNSIHGIDVRFETSNYHVYTLSIVNTSSSYNEDSGINVYSRQCGRWPWNFLLTECYIIGNAQKGLRLEDYDNCLSNGEDIAIVRNNNFVENNGAAVDLYAVKEIHFESNAFVRNTGVDIVCWTIPYYSNIYNSQVRFEKNTFVDNFVIDVVRALPGRSRDIVKTEIRNNTFENNTCFNVITILMDQSNSGDEANIVFITDNVFTNNVPRPFLHQFAHILTIATLAFDTTMIEIVNNILYNPMFPFDLIVIGENHGKKFNATMNFWSTNDEIQIQERIYDFSDKYELCTVYYFPYLNSPNKGDVVPDNTTRASVAFQRGNTIGGIVSGIVTLSNTGNDYFADRDIIIPSGKKLIIEPGVTIRFAHFSSVFVRGQLGAEGAEENKVTFAPFSGMISEANSTIRLVNGSESYEGRLEVLVDGVWHTVCNRYWTFQNAEVACRQLGYPGVRDSSIYLAAVGTAPIWNHPLGCTGREFVLQECEHLDDFYGSCSSHYYDVAIRCHDHYWGGLFFPLDSEVSILKHVVVQNAGYKRDWQDINNAIESEAVVIHLNHHVINNVLIQSPALVGLDVYYNTILDPNSHLSFYVDKCRPYNNQNNGYGARFHSIDGISLNDCGVTDCYTGFYFFHDSFYNNRQNIIKYLGNDRLVNTCSVNITLDVDDFIFLDPADGIHSCTDTISTTPGNRIGVSVFYTYYGSTISVVESGYTTLYVSGHPYDLNDNTVISNDSTITIHRQSSSNYNGDGYLMLIKVIDDRTATAAYPKDFSRLLIRNSYASNIGRYGFLIDPETSSQIAILNSSISNVDYAIYVDDSCLALDLEMIAISEVYYGIYIKDECQLLDLKMVAISDTQRGITIRRVENLRLVESVFNNVQNGIYLDYYYYYYYYNYYNVDITIANTQFISDIGGYEAIQIYEYIYGSEYETRVTIRDCAFQGYERAVDIYMHNRYASYNEIYHNQITVSNCTFFQNENAISANLRHRKTSLNLLGSTFDSHRDYVLNMRYASQTTSLTVGDNVFQGNERTVLRIPNILRHCHISNNVFWNNTGSNVVNVYEFTPLNSGITSTFDHVFSENVFTENKPTMRLEYGAPQCAVVTRVHNTIIHGNVFNNRDFEYELCLAAYPYFNIHDPVDAKFNCWNTTDQNEIAGKIFDLDDWNDRPVISFKPYALCDGLDAQVAMSTLETRSYLGGRVFDNLKLAAADGPYLINSDITVLENVTLTIEAGTELRFEADVGILVLGRLEAIGSESNKIRFLPRRNTSLPDYGDIRLTGGPSPWHGRVEIFAHGTWGTVIYYDWYWNTATVACRQLGYGPPVDYHHAYEFTLQGNPPRRVWYTNNGCFGEEDHLRDCSELEIDEACTYCPSYFHDYDVVLECGPGNGTAQEFANFWGGIRIIPNSGHDQSILQYVDIIGAGHLHSDLSPGLLLRHASPLVDHLSVTDSISDGIFIDSPDSAFSLQHTGVSRCSSGIVLNNIGHVSVTLQNVSTLENYQYGLRVIKGDEHALFSESLFGVIPVCTEDENEVITVDTYSELIYQSRNRRCDIIVEPKRNETLVLEVFDIRDNNQYYYYCFAYIYVYDNETDEELGRLPCYDSVSHVRVVSSTVGGALRISLNPEDYFYYNYDDYYGYYDHNEDIGSGFYFRITSSAADELIEHAFVDCDFSFNLNGGMAYSSSNWVPNIHKIRVDRCQFINNSASTYYSYQNLAQYALSLEIQNSEFEIQNCFFSNNDGIGGIGVAVWPTNDDKGEDRFGYVLNNEFTGNTQGAGMVDVIESTWSSDRSSRQTSTSFGFQHVRIEGNLFIENSPLDTSSVIYINDVYCNVYHNTIFNNDGGRVMTFNQYNLPYLAQECRNNLVTYNIGQDINEKYTIETAASGLRFHNNVFQNPANEYEMYAVSGDLTQNDVEIVNASRNWWGTTLPDRISERLHDSDLVIGFADVIFEPFLSSPPIDVQSIQCPVGYLKDGNDCYGYKGGAVDWQTAQESCMADGASLVTFTYGVSRGILQSRGQLASTPNGVWISHGQTQLLIDNNSIFPLSGGENEEDSEQKCYILELSDSDNGIREKPCDANYPYICRRTGRVNCPNSCFGNGICSGKTCICNDGWAGDDCSSFDCDDVNNCSGFGECVGPNQCKCRGGWQGRACSTSYCSRFDRCKPCAREDGCGWCDSKQACIPGTPYGPDKEDCLDWFYYGCFTTGSCSYMIERFDCSSRQCNNAASDTDNESCEQCHDVERCFSNSSHSCKTWDEEKCPSGIVSKNYNDTSRIHNAEIDEDVVLLDTEDVIIYKCPFAGSDDLLDHILFITNQIVDVNVGKIISSEQAEGILHRVGLVSNQVRHSLIMAKQADLTDAIRYADFDQPVEVEPAGDLAVTDDNPNDYLIEELLYGNISTNGSDVVELAADTTPYKCLGHLYVNEENPDDLSTSSFIFLPINDVTSSYELGDILISNKSSLNVETVRELVTENGTVFVHTNLADCSDNTTYLNGFKTLLSRNVLDSDEIDLSCRGGTGRPNLLILNDNITEDELEIFQNDTIIGGDGDRFVGKIVSKALIDDFVVLEVLTATTVSEFQALPHYSELPTRRRVKRGSVTLSPSFSFSESYSKAWGSLKCTGKAEFKYTPTFKFILEKSGFFSVKTIGMEFTGTKETTIEFKCEYDIGTLTVYIPLGQKRFGSFRFFIGYIPIVGSFHGTAGLTLKAQAQLKYSAGYVDTTKCTDKAAMIWRKGSGLSFSQSKTKCTTTASPTFSIGDSSSNPDAGLARASVTALLTVGVIAVIPPRGRLPTCGDEEKENPKIIQNNLTTKKNTICTKPPSVEGLSLSATITAKADVGGTLCAHNCPDPDKPLLLSATAGLDNFALTGALKIFGYMAQASYTVPIGFLGFRSADCISALLPCCLCEDESTGESVPGKVDPMTSECLCECYCDPPDNTIKSVKKKGEECQCDLCPDMKTLKRKYLDPECPCYCDDQEEREMHLDGSCPCECECEDGTLDTIDGNGNCPCECECMDCSKSTRGRTGCKCDDECPPCEPGETQVWENCKCVCRSENDCGIPPTCVSGRKGQMCDQPDCFPCQGCSGNGYCTSFSGQCSSFCRCNRRWEGQCCEILRPRRFWGDPHLETIDGKEYDYFDIGEFVFCHSRENDFGVDIRFFKYKQASLIGAVAIKAGSSVITITTPGTSSEDLPNLRVGGELQDVADGGRFELANSTVVLDIGLPTNTSDGETDGAVAYLSLQFHPGTTFTVEIRYSPVMERQYMNIVFGPTSHFLNTTEGLCGLMDNDDSNDFVGSDGFFYSDPITFAKTWRLNMTRPHDSAADAGISWSWKYTNFHENDTVDITYTDPDFVPSYTTDALSKQEIEMAMDVCTSLGIEDSLLDGCIFDIAVTNDTSFGKQETLKIGCPSQCSGKGTCVNNTCECLDGWSGDDCRIGDCGECVRGSCEAGFCKCEIGWEGLTCDKEATCFNVNNCTDPSQGQCLETDVCLCVPGFIGNDCSMQAECEGDCSSKGLCIDSNVCRCDYGWTNDTCNTPSCETHSFCTGNGDCPEFDVCDCYEGWTGLSCAIPDCTALNDCSGNGDCISPNTCKCYSGYVGNSCNLTLDCTNLNNCNGQGLCVVVNDRLSCRCNYGFTGPECNPDCTDVSECANRGTCVEPNLCKCEEGYTGLDCSLYSCEDLAYCSGHGDCIEKDVCDCGIGWSGDKCDIPSCSNVNDCSEQGYCVAYNTCECFEGWDGIFCNETILPNSDTPTFKQLQYMLTILENSAVGTSVLKVEANDTDSGRNGEVTYSIAGAPEFFVIDSVTGKISTRIVFDFESESQPQQYQLIGIAEDKGNPVKSSTTDIMIMVGDVNDNCPVVNTVESNPDLMSDLPVGTFAAQVSATDADSGVNSQLVYRFFQGSDAITDSFEINVENGTIHTKSFLTAGEYVIGVSVSDQGEPPCSAETQFALQVTDPLTTAKITTAKAPTTAEHTTTKISTTIESITTTSSSTSIPSTAANPSTASAAKATSKSPTTTEPITTTSSTSSIPSTIANPSTASTAKTTSKSPTTTEPITTISTTSIPSTTANPSTTSAAKTTTKSPTTTALSTTTSSPISTSSAPTLTTTQSPTTDEPTPVNIITTKGTTANAITTTTSIPMVTDAITSRTTTEMMVTSTTLTTHQASTLEPICNQDSDCNNNGLCVSGICECSCQFTGMNCETIAQCYEASMVIETIQGAPAEYTPALSDPTSDEFMTAVETLLPFIEELVLATETGANQYLTADITGFADGSLIVQYAITLSDGNMLSDTELKQEMDVALSENANEDFTVKEGSLEITAVQSPPPTTTTTRRPSTIPITIPTPPLIITQPPVTCPPITCESQYGHLHFQSGRAGFVSYSDQRCLCGTRSIGAIECPMDGTQNSAWNCHNIQFRCDEGSLNQQLHELNELCSITENTAFDVLKKVEALTSPAGSDIRVGGVEAVANILHNTATTVTPDQKITTTAISILSNLMEIDESILEIAQRNSGSSSRSIAALEVMLKSVPTSTDGLFSHVTKNIGVDVREVSKEELGSGLQFNSLSEAAVSYNIDSGVDPNPETVASLRLPTSLVDRIFVQGVTSHRISFVVYRTARLFISTKILDANKRRETYQRVVNTQVIASSVLNQIYTDLPEPVELRFLLKEAGDNIDRAQCVFWDFAADTNRGDWSSEGCVLVNNEQNAPECHCNHLTNFAVLTNIYENPVVHPDDTKPGRGFLNDLDLKWFSYVGCAMIFLSVILILLTYLLNMRSLLRKQQNKWLLNFCASLFGFCIMFIIVNSTNAPPFGKIGCSIVAGLTHNFVLVTMFWTGARCVYDLLSSRNTAWKNDSFFTLKASAFAWGIPVIIVLVTSVVTHVEYAANDICFLRRMPFLASVVAPVIVIVIFNMAMYTTVIVCLQGTNASLRSADDKHHSDILKSVKEGTAIIILLMLTYTAGYFTLIPPADYIAQPVFAICSFLLAFLLFFIAVVRQKEARAFWTSCMSFGSGFHSSSVSGDRRSFGDQEQRFEKGKSEWYMKERRRFNIRSSGKPGATGGNRTAHFDPDSVPLSQIEKSRFGDGTKGRSAKRNQAFEVDYY